MRLFRHVTTLFNDNLEYKYVRLSIGNAEGWENYLSCSVLNTLPSYFDKQKITSSFRNQARHAHISKQMHHHCATVECNGISVKEQQRTRAWNTRQHYHPLPMLYRWPGYFLNCIAYCRIRTFQIFKLHPLYVTPTLYYFVSIRRTRLIVYLTFYCLFQGPIKRGGTKVQRK
jgi:hypothetical protein